MGDIRIQTARAELQACTSRAWKGPGGEMLGHGVVCVGGDIWRSLVLQFVRSRANREQVAQGIVQLRSECVKCPHLYTATEPLRTENLTLILHLWPDHAVCFGSLLPGSLSLWPFLFFASGIAPWAWGIHVTSVPYFLLPGAT